MILSNQRNRDFQLGLDTVQEFHSNDVQEVVGRASSIEEIVEALSRRGCLNLTQEINFRRCSEFPIAGGGYCDIFRGELVSGTAIAIKSLRVFDKPGAESNRAKLLKHAARELYHWSKLRHPNVLPLMGLALFRGHISMVSEWLEYGNLTDYIRKNPGVNRLVLCLEICEAITLSYFGQVHGDLKGANVMISPAGTAMIADFGNTNLKELTLKFTNTTKPGVSLRWAAPELFSEGESKASWRSDVYAYGMTALETLTGKPPFEDKSEHWLLFSLAKGSLYPTRPESGISDELWEVLGSCWAPEPFDRPPISMVRSHLHGLTMSTGTIPDTSSQSSISDPITLISPIRALNFSNLAADLPRLQPMLTTSSSHSAQSPPPISTPSNEPGFKSLSSFTSEASPMGGNITPRSKWISDIPTRGSVGEVPRWLDEILSRGLGGIPSRGSAGYIPSRGSFGDIPNRAIARPIGTSSTKRTPSPERPPLGSKALVADDDEVVTPISRRNTTVSWGMPPLGPELIGALPGIASGLLGAPVPPTNLGSPQTPAPSPVALIPPVWQADEKPWGQFGSGPVPFAER